MRVPAVTAIARRQLLSPLFVLYLTAAYFVVVVPIRPEIASPRNLVEVAIATMPLLALAIGQTFVVITGGIDLSQTSLVGLASVVGASLMTEAEGSLFADGGSVAWAVAGVLAVGMVVGLAHGVAVALLRMPAFLVTLVSLMFLEGLATVYTRLVTAPTGGRAQTQVLSIGSLPEHFLAVGFDTFAGIPLPIWGVGAMAAVAHVLLAHTTWGRRLYAVGQNAATARVSGVPVRATLIAAYAVSGVCAALAALLYMARLETGKADLASEDVLLDCIAAVVIGGASLLGGRGTILGTILGALFISLVANSLNLFGTLKIWHILMVKGGIILLAAALESLRVRVEAREARRG